MSKSKRNQVLFSKPDDPKFLKLIKEQAGYREGPNVDTKRQKFNPEFEDDSDLSDQEEEQPQIVVVKSGDLTAAEAQREKLRIESENNTKPADLSERIIFKSKSSSTAKSKVVEEDKVGPKEKPQTSSAATNDEKKQKTKKSSKSHQEVKSKLSFDIDEFEDNE